MDLATLQSAFLIFSNLTKALFSEEVELNSYMPPLDLLQSMTVSFILVGMISKVLGE